MSRWRNGSNERVRVPAIDRAGTLASDLPFSLGEARIDMGHLLPDNCPCENTIEFYFQKTSDNTLERWSIASDGTTATIWSGAAWAVQTAGFTGGNVVNGFDGTNEIVYASAGQGSFGATGTDVALSATNGDTGSVEWTKTFDDLKSALGWGAISSPGAFIAAPRAGGGIYFTGRNASVSVAAIVDASGTVGKISSVTEAYCDGIPLANLRPHIGGYLILKPADGVLRFIEEGAGALSERANLAAPPLAVANFQSDVNGDIYICGDTGSAVVHKYDVDFTELFDDHWPVGDASNKAGINVAVSSTFASTLSPESIADSPNSSTPFVFLNHNFQSTGASVRLYSTRGTFVWEGLPTTGSVGGSFNGTTIRNYIGDEFLMGGGGSFYRYNQYGVQTAVTGSAITGRTRVLPCGHPVQVD